VYNNLRKYGDINYYQRHTGVEIDFILPEHSLALEVKNTGSQHDLRKLEKLSTSIGMNQYYVITQNYSALDGIISVSMV